MGVRDGEANLQDALHLPHGLELGPLAVRQGREPFGGGGQAQAVEVRPARPVAGERPRACRGRELADEGHAGGGLVEQG